jgi:hypothetical protein
VMQQFREGFWIVITAMLVIASWSLILRRITIKCGDVTDLNCSRIVVPSSITSMLLPRLRSQTFI